MFNVNLYGILGIDKSSGDSEIKKAYYKMAKKYHPDANLNLNSNEYESMFKEISDAYSVLSDPSKKADYDMRSKFGCNYNEYYELFDVKVEYDYATEKEKLERFKKNDVLDIYVEIDDEFDGNIEFERWVKCKSCDGTGSDFSSKIVIRDNEGNVLKTFDSDDGCDLCEGTGKYMGFDCSFCAGKGKVGINACLKCGGEKRILGKQRIKDVKISGDETRLAAMGHHSKNEPGKVGSLVLKKRP